VLCFALVSVALIAGRSRAEGNSGAEGNGGAEGNSGANIFAARCAVCHGPQAAGIPGTFPSLHEQVVNFAKSPEGRDYLIMVVTSGLMGELQVGGVRYNNVMPAQSGLSEADVAAVLSFLASALGKNDTGTAAVSATDVREARARHAQNSAASTRSLRPQAPASQPAGVQNMQRAWQNWTLNCQGCHRPDGTGSAGTTPSVAGTVSRFLSAPRGREYLARVPGVATAPLSDGDVSEVLNWMLWRFDPEHLPADFLPFSAVEVGNLRKRPLRLEASQMRSELLAAAGAAATP
jgi:mono/diheme cytochrome c family protein